MDAIVQVASTPAAGPFQVARPFKPPEIPPNLAIDFQWLYVDTATWIFFDTTTIAPGWTAALQTGTTNYIVSPSTFSMLQVLQTIRSNTKAEDINIVSDQMEQYMIWPGTDVAHMHLPDGTIDPLMWPPVGGWKGWCFQVINGSNVAVSCPPQ